MDKLINYLSQNKRRIARGLYFLGFLVEQLPDQDLPKRIFGRTLPARRSFSEGGTIADQIKPNGRKGRKRGSTRKTR